MFSDTPLGCESFDDDNTTHCDLNWAILDEQGASICNVTHSEVANQEACSFSMRGFTAFGFADQWMSWQYKWYRSTEYRYTQNDTHQISTNDFFGMKIDVKGDLKVDDFKIKLSAASKSTGHRLWERSNPPYINVSRL